MFLCFATFTLAAHVAFVCGSKMYVHGGEAAEEGLGADHDPGPHLGPTPGGGSLPSLPTPDASLRMGRGAAGPEWATGSGSSEEGAAPRKGFAPSRVCLDDMHQLDCGAQESGPPPPLPLPPRLPSVDPLLLHRSTCVV